MKIRAPFVSFSTILLTMGMGFSQDSAEPDPFASGSATPPDAPAKIDERTARENFKDFAKVYWYTEDLAMKATKRGGYWSDPETFSEQIRIKFLKFEEKDGGSVVSFTMRHKGEPNRKWEFTFSYYESGWKPTEGWETIDGRRQDLLQPTLFAPIPLEPLLKNEFAKYLEGKGRYGKVDRKPAAIKKPTYVCLTPERQNSGVAFHFEWEGKTFLASFEERAEHDRGPLTFHLPGQDEPVVTNNAVHEDFFFFLIHTFDPELLENVPPLKFQHPEPLRVDDPVFVYNGEDWIPGYIASSGDRTISVRLSQSIKDPVRVNGSPIIHGISGSIAGVLYEEYQPDPVKAVGAVRLELPRHLIEDPDSDSVPDEIFGIKRKEDVPPELARHVLKKLIYPEVLKVSLGMTEANLRAARPGLDPEFYQDKFFYGYEFDSISYLLNPRSRTVRYITFGNYGSNEGLEDERPGNALKFFDFLTAYLGAPDETFVQDRKEGAPDPDQLAFFWATDDYSMAWTLDHEFNSDISLDERRREPDRMIALKDNSVRLSDILDAPAGRKAIHHYIEGWIEKVKAASD